MSADDARAPGVERAEGSGAEDREAALAARLAATEDRLLRALADLDNQRKRVGRDIERERAVTAARLLRDWLDVVDSAERARAAFPGSPEEPAIAGLAAVAAQIEEVLRRQGIERLGAVGEPFDPERHEAVGTVPAGDIPQGAIAAVPRSGFALGPQLLRPAEVIVAHGPGSGA